MTRWGFLIFFPKKRVPPITLYIVNRYTNMIMVNKKRIKNDQIMDKTDIVNKYCRKLIDKRYTRLWDEMGHYNLNYRIKRIKQIKILQFY